MVIPTCMCSTTIFYQQRYALFMYIIICSLYRLNSQECNKTDVHHTLPQAHQCLHHLHALRAHGADELVDTESALFCHLLHHHIQEDEGASSADPCTAVHQQRLVQGSRVLLTDTADKVDKRHSIVWHSMIRPSCVVELMDYQVVFVRL